MHKISYDVALKEAMFILLPLLVLLVVKVLSGNFDSYLKLSDFSLAMSIMYGQLLAKSLDVPDKMKKRGRFSTFQVCIFTGAMLSITMYITFQTVTNIDARWYYAQIPLFVVSLVFYIPISALMSDLTVGANSKP